MTTETAPRQYIYGILSCIIYMKQRRSRRSFLSALATGVLAVLAGCTDRLFEPTQIAVENADSQEHTILVWVTIGSNLSAAEAVTVDSGSEAELSEEVRAPLSKKKYRITVQLDPQTEKQTAQMSPAYATSFTYNEEFERLKIVVGEEGDVTAEPLKGE